MKKIIASILGLTLVFTTAIAVSAAPTVSGEVSYKLMLEGNEQDSLEGKVNFDGQLNPKTDYKLVLKGSEADASVGIDEASFTHKADIATIQAGFFGYNTSIIDMLAKPSPEDMKAPIGIKVSPNLGEKLQVGIGILPRSEGAFTEDFAYQVEANYVMDMVSLGVNYQTRRIEDQDPALTWEVTATPVESVQIYGEFGQAIGGADLAVVGAKYSNEKLSLRGEYDLENDSTWAAKVNYNFTENISGEFKTDSADDTYAKLTYTF